MSISIAGNQKIVSRTFPVNINHQERGFESSTEGPTLQYPSVTSEMGQDATQVHYSTNIML